MDFWMNIHALAIVIIMTGVLLIAASGISQTATRVLAIADLTDESITTTTMTKEKIGTDTVTANNSDTDTANNDNKTSPLSSSNQQQEQKEVVLAVGAGGVGFTAPSTLFSSRNFDPSNDGDDISTTNNTSATTSESNDINSTQGTPAQ